ncbi:M14 family metallopeptidase [Flavobacteriaceae bacterium MHTCC 0001]
MKLKSVLSLLFLTSIKLVCAQSFSFYNTNIKPGTKHHFKIPISDDKDSTFIPITVFHGIKKGPTLGITAGVHGYEYPPILAGQQLIKSINPKTLKGTVILVQISNLSSFSSRSPFKSALDGKNLNRIFPGDVNGSVTEKIAAFITNNVIVKSNFFLDMHAGDAPEDLMSYSAYYSNSSMPKASQKGMQMAQALLFDHIVVFNTDGKDYIKKDKPSLYCSAEAFKRGIPSVDIECGRLGLPEKDAVLKIETGVLNMLNYLDMVSTGPEIKKNNTYQFISDRTYQESNHNGIFYPSKSSGDYVKKGMKLGVITGYFGDILEIIYAKKNGVILYIIGTPPINKGETIVTIGDISK